MKKIFTILTFVLILGIMTACIQDKSDQELTQGVSFSVNGESFEMVLVEGGTFTMGCTGEQGDDCEDDEKPAHEETLPTFYMGKYEVTQKLWTAVMGSVLNRSNNSGCEDCPVENISWKDTQEFITKLNILTGRSFRLPTEAEWEYAARGGNRSKGYKYSGSNKIDEVAWYIDNYQKIKQGNRGTTHPVGMKKSNELGLYDMSGNVWEWCSDWYTQEYTRNGKTVHPGWPFEGTHLFFRRVLRGGSWGGNAKGCRVSYIDYDVEKHRDEYGGFRLALNAESDSIQVITN
ncbi:Formylglycine-generating enzyme, required for sulfatase activity, contains SUMF1/FGE domain [Porphyromonadaceae bacterium KH3CP3RA]|nr:Formylglycine-generating enzyme, required for sulfatase activity, contains SUMF1/FGE domain [Porphyromonadaceae bacterium KH3CP3RA]